MRLTFARAAVSAAALLAVAACASNTPTVNLQKPYNATDNLFSAGAHQASNAEIAAAAIAQQRSSNPDVLAYAAQMITDHTGENAAESPIASQLGIVLPDNLDTDQSTLGYVLKNVAASEFDAAYINGSIAGHQANYQNHYQAEIGGGSNPQLLSYANTYQQQVLAHTTEAQAIKAKYGF